MEYPLIDLTLALQQYREEKELTCAKLAQKCDIANSVVSALCRSPKTLEKRRINTIRTLLDVLGYTLDDFDPRIKQAAQAVKNIYEAYDAGVEMARIAARLGFTDIRRFYTVISNVRQDKINEAGYGSIVKILAANEPTFDAWVQGYIEGPLFKGRETMKEREQRLKRLREMRAAREAEIYKQSSTQDWLRRLAAKAGFDDIDKFDPVFENDRITFYTEDRVYRCVITKESFTAFLGDTDTVSVRHRFKRPVPPKKV